MKSMLNAIFTKGFTLAVLLLISSSFVQPAEATCYSTDQSDLWWTDPPGSEDGWGFQLVQRCSTIFATLFVYGPTGTPTWYVATMEPNPPGSLVWTGNLYTTTGPWFGAASYNPASFAATQVGTMTWTPDTVTTGTLSYTVGGVQVTKSVIRQTIGNEYYDGKYIGAVHTDVTDCANPSFNGSSEVAGTLTIVQTDQSITLQSSACSYTGGTFAQVGQMGQINNASFACSDGSAGTISFDEMQVTISGITGRFEASYTKPAGCQSTGWLGGMTSAL